MKRRATERTATIPAPRQISRRKIELPPRDRFVGLAFEVVVRQGMIDDDYFCRLRFHVKITSAQYEDLARAAERLVDESGRR